DLAKALDGAALDGRAPDSQAPDSQAPDSEARAGQEPAGLPGTGSLAGWAAAVRAQTGRIAEALPAARDFWSARPAPDGEVVLPGLADTPTAAEPAAQLALEWSPDLDAALTAGAAALGATRFEVLLAGVHALLARYGNPVTSVAVDLSTRRDDTAGEIGMWVNELPITLGADLETSFADLVRAARAEARAVYQHREVPLGRALPGLPPSPALAPVSISYRRIGAEASTVGSPAPAGLSVDWLLAPATVR